MRIDDEVLLIQWKQYLVVFDVMSTNLASTLGMPVVVVAKDQADAQNRADVIKTLLLGRYDISTCNVESVTYLSDLELFETSRRVIMDQPTGPRRIRTDRKRNQ